MGRIVIAQRPNLWLWIFVAASLVELVTGTVTPIGLAARIVALVFLVI